MTIVFYYSVSFRMVLMCLRKWWRRSRYFRRLRITRPILCWKETVCLCIIWMQRILTMTPLWRNELKWRITHSSCWGTLSAWLSIIIQSTRTSRLRRLSVWEKAVPLPVFTNWCRMSLGFPLLRQRRLTAYALTAASMWTPIFFSILTVLAVYLNRWTLFPARFHSGQRKKVPWPERFLFLPAVCYWVWLSAVFRLCSFLWQKMKMKDWAAG